MTLKEVAVRAGVPVSTVSRIINFPGDSFARKEVRDHVWAIIKETDYTPNQNVRALKLGKNPSQEPSAGALVCILGKARTIEDNPSFAQLTRVTEQRALEQGYPVRRSYSVFDTKINIMPEKIKSLKADGAIILGRSSDNYIGFLEQQYKNLIYVGRNVISADCDQITCDGHEATQIAMNYLIACGHRRTGYIGEISNEVWYQAHLDTLRENGLEYSRSLANDCPQNGVEDYQGAEHPLKTASPLPAAVFCTADIAAITALCHFTGAKIKVPEQLSLISMDNIELSGYVSPMLIIVGMLIAETGNMAVRTLIDRIQKRHKPPMKIFLPSKLVIREGIVNLNEGMYI